MLKIDIKNIIFWITFSYLFMLIINSDAMSQNNSRFLALDKTEKEIIHRSLSEKFKRERQKADSKKTAGGNYLDRYLDHQADVKKWIKVLENRDEKPLVRVRAAETLGKIGPEAIRATEALSNALNMIEPKEVRVSSAEALGKIGPVALVAVSPLVEVLVKDEAKEVRFKAAEALGKIGHGAFNGVNEYSIKALVRALVKDDDEEVRAKAAEALGKIGQKAKDVVPALTGAIAKDQPKKVRLSAIFALGKIGPEAKAAVPELILIFGNKDEDKVVRISAVEALGKIGPEAKAAVPELILIFGNKDEDKVVRISAVETLGKIGPEAKAAVPELILIFGNKDEDKVIRISAAETLGKIGTEAKDAVLSLTQVIMKEPFLKYLKELTKLRVSAIEALGKIGPEAKTAVPELITILKRKFGDKVMQIRAAETLGKIGTEAKDAITALTDALAMDRKKEVRESAAESLKKLAVDLSVHKAIDTIPDLKIAHRALLRGGYIDEANMVGLSIHKLSSIKPPWWRILWVWIINEPVKCILILIYTMWAIVSLMIFWMRPHALLRLNNVLKTFEFNPKWGGGIAISLRYLLLIGFLNDRTRVLDAWVKMQVKAVRAEFEKKDTVIEREMHIGVPVEMDRKTIADLEAKHLRPVFNNPPACLLIWGEGGAGKTSLACKIAKWAMSENVENRICSHIMLPILIDHELDDTIDQPIISSIRRQLQIITRQSKPVPEDLLERLLCHKRILLIIDHLSEMSASTRAQINPYRRNFLANALLVTSRLKEKELLGDLKKSTIKPLRIQGNQLSFFLEAYLRKREKRNLFDDPEFFDACSRLSSIVGQRDITILLAKLFAEQLISAKEGFQNPKMPDNIPDLMIDYINRLNQSIKDDRLPDHDVHSAAKAVAWECMKKALKPGHVKLGKAMDILISMGLTDGEAKTRLDYMQQRLRIIYIVEPTKDRYRFVLDTLSEYLAGLHLIELYSMKRDSEICWRNFLHNTDKMEGLPVERKGFLLALRDCCIAKRHEFNMPCFIDLELAKRA